MKEIKFRAKSKETNEYVYGILYSYGIKGETDTYAIIDNKFNVHSIYFDSIQQYTGLCDIEGTEIYEGDILYDDAIKAKTKVYYTNGAFVVDLGNMTTYLANVYTTMKVVGNSYDTK